MSECKLAVATPSMGTIKTKTVESLIGMLKNFPHEYYFLSHEGSIIHHMRERLVKKAIELDCTHLLFVDSDMVFDKDAVLKLLERDKDIIGVNCNRRKLPLESTAILDGSEAKDGLVKAISVGTGFMLIKLSIFDYLPEPWFFWQSNQSGDLVTGEDYWFCSLARKHNFDVWCDLSVKIGHLGETIF